MENIFIAFNILFFLITISISYLFKTSYPKEINSLVGYRTKRSMASKEAWLLANSYSSKLLFNYAIMAVSLQVILFILADPKTSILAGAGFWIITLFITLVQTEMKLKRSNV